jgi:hypothetical protein
MTKKPIDKILSYLDQAAECRALARRLSDPTAKSALEEMARTWEYLAALNQADFAA